VFLPFWPCLSLLLFFRPFQGAFSNGQKDEFLKKLSLSFRLLLFLIVPASVLLLVLRAQVVRIILRTGQFGLADTRLTAACLALFALSIFAYGLVILLSKAFYALHNTKTPALISLIVVGVNVGLCFLFIHFLKLIIFSAPLLT